MVYLVTNYQERHRRFGRNCREEIKGRQPLWPARGKAPRANIGPERLSASPLAILLYAEQYCRGVVALLKSREARTVWIDPALCVPYLSQH
jgi:hypothetical protein